MVKLKIEIKIFLFQFKMTTLKEIFSLSIEEINSLLEEYEHVRDYNDSKKLKQLIVYLNNSRLLNDEDSKIVDSYEFDLVIKMKIENYEQFIHNYNILKKCIVLNNTDKNSSKSWKNPKVIALKRQTSGVKNIIINNKNIDVYTLISSSYDGIIKIWDLKTFECIKTLTEHKDFINKIIIKSINNIDYLISCSEDKTIKIWNLQNFNFIKTLEGHTRNVNNIIIGSISSFDSFNHKIIDNSKIIDKNTSIDYLISCSLDDTIKIWNLQTFECVATLHGHESTINKIMIKNINNIDYLISCSLDSTIKIWNLQTFECKVTLMRKRGNIEDILIFNNILFSCSQGEIIIWDLQTFEFKKILGNHCGQITNILTTNVNISDSDNNYLITSSYDKTIKIWDLQTFKCIATLEGHQEYIVKIIIKSVSTFDFVKNKFIIRNNLISCSYGGTIKIWDLQTFECISTLEAHTCVLNDILTFNNNLISCAEDGSIKIWETN